MKNYLKLVNFEVNRFFKLFLILITFTTVFQLIGVFIFSKRYMNQVEKLVYEKQLSLTEYMEQNGTFLFSDYLYSMWFNIPIYLCIAMLMIYVFFIWYRDWFGKNTFIYRLLMLPTERVAIYFAKLTTIMIFVLSLIALQILLMLIEIQIVHSMIPADFRTHFSIYEIYSYELVQWLYPFTFTRFIMNYGIGLIFVAVLFTAILFERSYRIKGIFFAIGYGLLSFAVFMAPILLNGFYYRYFYPLEILLMGLVTSTIVFGSAIGVANYLLKHKIRV